MSLFGKKNNGAPACCRGAERDAADSAEQTKATDARVKILGSGCAKCNALEVAVKAALSQLGLDASVEHVTDFSQIAAYGVMTTPALVVDGKVLSFGKVLKIEEAIKLLRKATDGDAGI